jgi:rhodanese-related sulfurtransferase
MKPVIFITILLATAFLFVACSSKTKVEEEKTSMDTKAESYENISPKEAKARLEAEEGIILLDVRTPEEYAESHIPNSILIPVDVIEKEAPEKLTDKNANIFVYCRSGRRSVAASEALVKMGYTNVYNLGGIIDWPYETKNEK